LCKTQRFAGLYDFGPNFYPLTDLCGCNEIEAQAHGHEAGDIRQLLAATQPHCIVGEGGNQAAVDEAATIRMRSRGSKSKTKLVRGVPA
jgi:hypothetical protein